MQLHEQLKLSRLQYGRRGALVKGQEWPISVGMAQSHVTGRWIRGARTSGGSGGAVPALLPLP